MGYTTPLTAVANAPLTAAQYNASVRDNFLETGPAKATASGRLLVTTGAGAIAERVPAVVRVTGGDQFTTSTSFTDLVTVGPRIPTLLTGASAIFMVSAFIMNDTAGQGGYMGVTVTGASSIGASTDRALRIMSGTATERAKASYVGMFDGTLTPGSNTFTAQYRVVASGQANFDERELLVIPL